MNQRYVVAALAIVAIVLLASLTSAIAYYRVTLDAKEREHQDYALAHSHSNAEYDQLQANYSSLLSTQSLPNVTSDIYGVYFSPNGGCKQQIVSWINKANVSIHILIYSFTLNPVGDALIGVRNRNDSIDIRIVFEKSQITSYSQYQRLKSIGLGVRNDTNPHDMHDKIMIVDGKVVLTGSFNWSNNAEQQNNENLVVITSNSVASTYEAKFQRIWNSSQS